MCVCVCVCVCVYFKQEQQKRSVEYIKHLLKMNLIYFKGISICHNLFYALFIKIQSLNQISDLSHTSHLCMCLTCREITKEIWIRFFFFLGF